MYSTSFSQISINRRVRAILLTHQKTLTLIKRVKPSEPEPYWVAPGGGVEDYDSSLLDALERELCEELGATAEVLDHAFVLKHQVADKDLEEHFFICYLLNYDLSLRTGPEFLDPTRGDYILDEIPLTQEAITRLNLRTPELQDWLLQNLELLNQLSQINIRYLQ